HDALNFEFAFPHDEGAFPLRLEYELLEMLFREQIENKTVSLYPAKGHLPGAAPTPLPDIRRPSPDDQFPRLHRESQVMDLCRERSKRGLCHCLTISMQDRPLEIEDTVVSRCLLNQPMPGLVHGVDGEFEAMEEWHEALERLLQIWI